MSAMGGALQGHEFHQSILLICRRSFTTIFAVHYPDTHLLKTVNN